MRKRSLKNHIELVHTGLKPFKCSICNYKAAYKNDLKKHIDGVHKLLCDYEAAIKSDLNRHEESIHEGIKPFKCTNCDKKSLIKRFDFHSQFVQNLDKEHRLYLF